jgi:tetratricopeptide (TPR) repeat protein
MLAQILDPQTRAQSAWIQANNAAPYFAASQFASPGQVLAMKAADPRLPYVGAMRHYARATAYANLHNRTEFDREIAALDKLRRSGGFQSMIDQGVPAPDLLLLAETVARARFASSTGRLSDAIKLYRDAVEVEARIPYMEPPFWYYPVHQSLGAALYRAGRYREAQEAFTAALARYPNNGWALYGLAASERALGNGARAAATQAALKRAWMGDPRWLKMERI